MRNPCYKSLRHSAQTCCFQSRTLTWHRSGALERHKIMTFIDLYETQYCKYYTLSHSTWLTCLGVPQPTIHHHCSTHILYNACSERGRLDNATPSRLVAVVMKIQARQMKHLSSADLYPLLHVLSSHALDPAQNTPSSHNRS